MPGINVTARAGTITETGGLKGFLVEREERTLM